MMSAESQDDWVVSDAGDMNMDPALLHEAAAAAPRMVPKLFSLLVVRRGALVLEQYYRGAERDVLMDLRSATKSFTASGIAAAIADGRIPSLEASLEDLLPDVAAYGHAGFGTITLRELLSMTSGLYWRTGNRLGERFIRRLHASPDWLRFIARLPVEEDMRGKFCYRSPDSHLLSCILSRATGQCASDYIRERLFDPMGIFRFEWASDPQGNSAGHIHLRLAARDMAKLGWLYLNQGQWRGTELLSKEWIAQATAPQTEGMAAFGHYGYHWWVLKRGAYDAYTALGHGGQLILVVPACELVMVTTADPNVSRWKFPLELLERFLLPAIR